MTGCASVDPAPNGSGRQAGNVSSVTSRDALRATAAMIHAQWPGRWEGDLALRLEELAAQTEHEETRD